jgi:hypothetical protein
MRPDLGSVKLIPDPKTGPLSPAASIFNRRPVAAAV